MGVVPRGRRQILRMAAATVVVALLAWQGYVAYERRATAGRLFGSGSIEATEVAVSPRVPGRVIRMLVSEGDQVHAGQVLAEMDPREAHAQVDQARAAVEAARARVAQARQAVLTQQQVTEAQVAQAQAQLLAAETRVPQAQTTVALQDRTVREAISIARAQLSAAEAAVLSARSNLTKAQNDLMRAKDLLAQGAVAQQQVDQAQVAYDAAVAQDRSAQDAVAQARATLASAEANQLQVDIRQQDVRANQAAVTQARAALENARTGYTLVAQRRQDLAATQAELVQAEAALRYAELLAEHNTIAAPSDGVVLTKNIEPGEVVATGTSIYTLINPQDMWLRVFVPENQIGRVRVGQHVRVTVDTFPNRTFPGRVTEISSQAEFTPGNVQTKEDRVKLVFGVKIQLDNKDGSLKPGMPADAEILVDVPAEQAVR